MPSQKLFSAFRPQFGLKIRGSPPLDPPLFHPCSSRISILITKGEGTGKICFPYRAFGISTAGSFQIHFTITGTKNIVRYTEDFVIYWIYILTFHSLADLIRTLSFAGVRIGRRKVEIIHKGTPLQGQCV